MSISKTYYLDYDSRKMYLNILHSEGCLFLPANTNCIGVFENDKLALDAAKSKYKRALLCPICCAKVLNEVDSEIRNI